MEELLTNTTLIKIRAKKARESLMSKGYIYNEVYGWERPKILERFGLDPNMTAIPSKRINDYELLETKVKEKDPWGKETGRVVVNYQKIENPNRKIDVIADNWINYYEWKKEEERKRVEENKRDRMKNGFKLDMSKILNINNK